MYFVCLIAVVVIAGGFIVLHHARRQASNELKIAGWLLVIGGVVQIASMFFMPHPGVAMHHGMMHEGKMLLAAPPPPGAPHPPQAETPAKKPR